VSNSTNAVLETAAERVNDKDFSYPRGKDISTSGPTGRTMGVLTRRMPSLISGLAVDSLGRGVQRSRTESSRLSSLKFIGKKIFVIIETLLYNKGRLYYK